MGLIAGLLSIILGIIVIILGLHIAFAFFGLNAATAPGIVASINAWAASLSQPFTGFLPPITFGNFTLDTPAILALLVYGVIGGLLLRVLRGRSY